MSKKLLLFGTQSCVLCQGWKKKLEHLKIPYDYYDVETPEGLTEMAYHNIGRIPALVAGNQKWEEVNPAEIPSEKLQELAGSPENLTGGEGNG